IPSPMRSRSSLRPVLTASVLASLPTMTSCRISSRKSCPASSVWACGRNSASVWCSVVDGRPAPGSHGTPGAFVWRTPMSSGIPGAYAAAPSPLPTRRLGQTGVAVTLCGLGGEGVLRPYDRAVEAVRVIHRALEHGVKYCDTAPAYAGSLDYYGAAL